MDTILSRARAFVASLLEGHDPGNPSSDFGEFAEEVSVLYEAFRMGGSEGIKRTFERMPRHNSRYELLRPPSLVPKIEPPKASRKFVPTATPMLPLPESARLPEGLGDGACQWLDDFITFSEHWSPRGFDGFHETVGLWVLSTIAARRVAMPLGPKMQYTPLYLALTARSGLYAKTTTAAIGTQVIKKSGLGFLLADDDYTPQSFISSLTGTVPSNFTALHGSERTWAELRVAFAAQRGWFFDEFSQMVEGMQKKNGHQNAFRSILRRMDDCEDSYASSTIGRGEDRINSPYLSFLVNMTPADLRDSGKRGNRMWSDGFWARFTFVGPDGQPMKKGRLPNEPFVVPAELIKPLHYWHERLGIPRIVIEPDNDNPGKFKVVRGEFPEETCIFGEGVEDAFFAYSDALSDLIHESEIEDLDSNYARFAIKALRVAMLIASLENDGRIEMQHWALAQSITERWRANLHAVFAQINELAPTVNESVEDKIMVFVERWIIKDGRPPTMREIRQYVSGASSRDLILIVESMVETGRLRVIETTRGSRITKYYGPPIEESLDGSEFTGKG